MNRYMDLTPVARRLHHARKCAPDIGWFDIGLAVEHLGAHDHSLDKDVLSDRARVNALQEMGFEVIELTNDIVGDFSAFETIASRIARLLGKRLRARDLGQTKSRLDLRRGLRAWNMSYGDIS